MVPEVVVAIEGVAEAITEVGEVIVVAVVVTEVGEVIVVAVVVTEVVVEVTETVEVVVAGVEVALHQGNREGEYSAR